MYICIYVYMYVCMYVCMYICTNLCIKAMHSGIAIIGSDGYTTTRAAVMHLMLKIRGPLVVCLL